MSGKRNSRMALLANASATNVALVGHQRWTVARLTPAHEQMIKDALFDARDRLTLATRRL